MYSIPIISISVLGNVFTFALYLKARKMARRIPTLYRPVDKQRLLDHQNHRAEKERELRRDKQFVRQKKEFETGNQVFYRDVYNGNYNGRPN
jgi:hypothetical protein